MMSSNLSRNTRHAGCPTTAARTPRAARLYFVAALVCALCATTACKRSEPTQPAKPPAAKPAKAEPTQQELEKLAREREAFGLPLPPDAHHIHRTQAYVTASSSMKLAEIEAFYKSRLVDYEYLYPEAQTETNRTPRELHIIGLRAYMPQIKIRFRGGKNGTSSLDFRPALEPPADKPASDLAASKPGSSTDSAPVDRRREKGMPVLDRNANGELIAPGARWGEPYTPPEGTPLHTKRNSENFGRNYGEWQSP